MSEGGLSSVPGVAGERYRSEQEFHDHIFEEGTRAKVSRFYDVVKDCSDRYEQQLMAMAPAGVNVLEYGCGVGTDAFALARQGAEVSAIDISEEGIRQASAQAETEGLHIACRQMNAEDLEFDPSTFDVVCGRGIIHHLDLDRAYDQLRRVLKPSGSALFMEPLGHNPIINEFRRRTPSLRTPDEHPLLLQDFDLAKTYFRRVDVKFYGLFSLLALPVPESNFRVKLIDRLSAMDAAVLPKIGKMARFSWFAIMKLSEPRQAG